jgi:hypothetical protein
MPHADEMSCPGLRVRRVAHLIGTGSHYRSHRYGGVGLWRMGVCNQNIEPLELTEMIVLCLLSRVMDEVDFTSTNRRLV